MLKCTSLPRTLTENKPPPSGPLYYVIEPKLLIFLPESSDEWTLTKMRNNFFYRIYFAHTTMYQNATNDKFMK